MEKFWKFLVVAIAAFLILIDLNSQNLLFNGDFEDVKTYDFNTRRNRDTFYAMHWFEATNATVDIIRDLSACNEAYTKSIEPMIDFCIEVKSGNYCIGFGPIHFMGAMEHISGRLKEELISGKRYLVSFNLKKQPTETPLIPKGIGIKFHEDSLLFKGGRKDIDNQKVWALYDNLFEEDKIFSDFELDEYVLDTSWVEHKFIYTARGGEKYLTLGRFAYENDKEIIQQFNKLRHNPWEAKILKYVKSDKSKVCKRFFDNKEEFDLEGHNYYFIDLIEVTSLDTVLARDGKISVGSDKGNLPAEAYNYVDLDPMTSTPSEREINVDKGFVGDIKMELGVRLKPMEKYVLEYGRKNQIIIINTAESGGYDEMKFLLENPAKKLRKKPIRFYVEKTNRQEIESLKSRAEDIRQIAEPNFEGILIKRMH